MDILGEIHQILVDSYWLLPETIHAILSFISLMYEKHSHIIKPVFLDLQTMEHIENLKYNFPSNKDLCDLVNAIVIVNYSHEDRSADIGIPEATMQF